MLVGKFSLYIKSIGILFVVQYRICPGATFGLLTNPVDVWKEYLSLLAGRNLPIDLIDVHNKDMPWFEVEY